jgi:hypothetical protein
MPAPRGLDDFEIGHHLKNGLVIKSAAESSRSCIHHAQQKQPVSRHTQYGAQELGNAFFARPARLRTVATIQLCAAIDCCATATSRDQ